MKQREGEQKLSDCVPIKMGIFVPRSWLQNRRQERILLRHYIAGPGTAGWAHVLDDESEETVICGDQHKRLREQLNHEERGFRILVSSCAAWSQ